MCLAYKTLKVKDSLIGLSLMTEWSLLGGDGADKPLEGVGRDREHRVAWSVPGTIAMRLEKNKDNICWHVQEFSEVAAKDACRWREVGLWGQAEGAVMGRVVLIYQAKKLGCYF